MGFHENLLQTFQNFKNVFLGSTDISNIGDGKITGAIDYLNNNTQGKLTAGTNITIATTYNYIDVTSSSEIVTSPSELPSVGISDIYYICSNNNEIYLWNSDSNNYILSELTARFVTEKPDIGSEEYLYVLTSDNTVWSCTVVPNTISSTGGSGGSETLEELTDVDISSPTDSQVLKFNATSQKWENSDDEGGVDELEELTDVDISSPTDSQVLKFNATSQKWENGSAPSSGHTIEDSSGTELTQRDTMQFVAPFVSTDDSINSKTEIGLQKLVTDEVLDVVNPLPSRQVVSKSIDDLEDTDISSPSNGQILKFNSTSEKWENSNNPGGVEIDDTTTSSSAVWSSSKVSTEISAKTEIDDTSTTVSNTWSASKISSVIAALALVDFSVVQTLPIQDISTHTIYLVPKSTAQTDDVYDEYIYINNDWEHIGSTTVDLSNYYTSSQTDTLLASKQDELTVGDGIDITSGTINSKIDNNTITFNSQGQMVASTGANSLNDLSDVTISSATNKQVLQYNSTTSKFENVGIITYNGSPVNLTLSLSGDVLTISTS